MDITVERWVISVVAALQVSYDKVQTLKPYNDDPDSLRLC